MDFDIQLCTLENPGFAVGYAPPFICEQKKIRVLYQTPPCWFSCCLLCWFLCWCHVVVIVFIDFVAALPMLQAPPLTPNALQPTPSPSPPQSPPSSPMPLPSPQPSQLAVTIAAWWWQWQWQWQGWWQGWWQQRRQRWQCHGVGSGAHMQHWWRGVGPTITLSLACVAWLSLCCLACFAWLALRTGC